MHIKNGSQVLLCSFLSMLHYMFGLVPEHIVKAEIFLYFFVSIFAPGTEGAGRKRISFKTRFACRQI